MLTALDILRITEPVELMYMQTSEMLLLNVCKHLSTGKGLRTAEWEIQKLSELGALTEESIEIIAKNSGKEQKAIREAIAKALEIEMKDVDAILTRASDVGIITAPNGGWQASESVMGMLRNLVGQAQNDANIVNTVMLQSTLDRYTWAISSTVQQERELIEKLYSATDLSSLQAQTQVVQTALNQATFSVVSGAEARTTALRRTIKALVEKGITGYIDKAGHHWTPEAYINMDMRTTSHNAAVYGQRERSAEYGVHTFQVTSHRGARPLCAPYQGRFYSWDNTAGAVHDVYGRPYPYEPINRTSYGEPAGLFGINCGHNPVTFIDGFSYKRYDETDNYVWEYRQYEEMQKQRYIERQIRKERTEALGYKEAGDETAFQDTAGRIKAREEQYKKYCEDHNLTPRNDRLQVAGYDRSMKSQVLSASKKVDAPSYAYGGIGKQAKAYGVEPVKVNKLKESLTHDQIVERIAGGDQTTGSCSSLALAYTANKYGFDVLDFRGGKSCSFFSKAENINNITKAFKGKVIKSTNDFEACHELFKSVKEGHLYYFATGQHAAIIRKGESGLEYLEMQSRYPDNNTWHALNDLSLKNRFVCKKSHSSYGHKLEFSNDLFDLDDVNKSVLSGFIPYINTPVDKQKKGVMGGIK